MFENFFNLPICFEGEGEGKEELPTGEEPKSTSEEKPPEEKKTEEEKSSLVNEDKDKEKEETDFVPLTADDLKFTTEEGQEVNEELVTEFLTIYNSADLDANGKAQALIDLQNKVMTEASHQMAEEFTKTQEQWRQEVIDDKDIGGDALDGNITKSSQLLDKYGSDELRQMLDMTGLGNNIHMVKFFVNLSKDFSEGDLVEGSPPKPGGDLSTADKLFG